MYTHIKQHRVGDRNKLEYPREIQGKFKGNSTARTCTGTTVHRSNSSGLVMLRTYTTTSSNMNGHGNVDIRNIQCVSHTTFKDYVYIIKSICTLDIMYTHTFLPSFLLFSCLVRPRDPTTGGEQGRML